LTLVAGSSFTPEILGALRDLAAHNQPYVRARAIVGVSGLQWVAHAAISWALQQDLPVFKTVAAAMDWLVEQAGQAPSNWDPARRDSLDCTFPAAD
ncbi:MAG: hypothetical protein HY700_21085, partial [Gemmatimonadetes bacterium]|nr:hypothetical protein [Gemmatimonadota bacterium]